MPLSSVETTPFSYEARHREMLAVHIAVAEVLENYFGPHEGSEPIMEKPFDETSDMVADLSFRRQYRVRVRVPLTGRVNLEANESVASIFYFFIKDARQVLSRLVIDPEKVIGERF